MSLIRFNYFQDHQLVSASHLGGTDVLRSESNGLPPWQGSSFQELERDGGEVFKVAASPKNP
ncbi:uncharacterized protein METZ01_LOCUS118745 [marine metagenome]|uniref:Uncharacterized protein n=1 Tax=marine metagenome TaxID=408172 RepID=A0A381XN97_9ZZZZ